MRAVGTLGFGRSPSREPVELVEFDAVYAPGCLVKRKRVSATVLRGAEANYRGER